MGMLIMVKPMSREYPKCREGMAAKGNQHVLKRIHVSELTVLIAELILRPNASLAALAMHSIHESIAFRHLRIITIIIRVAQESRGHTRPQRKHNESEEVRRGHRSSPRFIESWPCGTAIDFTYALARLYFVQPVAYCGIVVEPDEEKDATGYVDERVDAVAPHHEERVRKEVLLDGDFVEEVQSLLDADNLESVLAGDVDGALDECDCSEGTTDLVDLMICIVSIGCLNSACVCGLPSRSTPSTKLRPRKGTFLATCSISGSRTV